MRKLMIAAAVALGGLSAIPAIAAETVPQTLSEHLDKARTEFTWSAAAERRHMIMRETQRQQRYGRGGHGRGYGYGRHHGGPPPWAPAYGYRRPPPPSHYGPRW